MIEPWGVDRAGDLLALVDVAYPDDRVTLDELEVAGWGVSGSGDPDRGVLGRTDGTGAIVLRGAGVRVVLDVIAADPAGPVTDLLDAATATAGSWGAAELVIGGSMPDHLWPGLTAWEASLIAALEDRGFTPLADATVVAVPTTFRSEPDDRVSIVSVIDSDVVGATTRWVRASASGSAALVERAIDQATCAVAIAPGAGDVVGVIAHSVGRDGWIGPLVVSEAVRRRGVGTALIAHAARELMVAGFSEAPLLWIAPESAPLDASWPAAFLDRVGARPWRTFQRYALALS